MKRKILSFIRMISKNLFFVSLLQCLFLGTLMAKETGEQFKPKEGTLDRIEVTGTVTDANGQPIPGATVLVEGTNTGTATDIEGKFSLDAPEGAVLLISFIGYQSQRITVENQTAFTITLEEDQSSLDEVVVVGYGTQKKVNVNWICFTDYQ